MAHQEFNKHRKLLYQNHHQKTKDYLHGSIIGLLKRVLACPADHHISDDEVLFKTGISLPSDLLRLRRSLGSLLAIGETACWGLLNQDVQWVELIQDDLLHHCSDLGAPDEHLPRWIEIISCHRGCWKRLVPLAAEHAIGVRAARGFYVASAHMKFLDRLEQVPGYTHHAEV